MEGLSHVIQRCSRTARPREARHDSVIGFLDKALQKVAFEVLIEPTIPTPAGIRRPDMVIFSPGQRAVVLNVMIVTDNLSPSIPFGGKVDYYQREPAVRSWVAERTGCDLSEVEFTTFVLNWRGAMAAESGQVLLDLKLTKNQFELLSVRILEMGYKCWQSFKDSTFRAGRRRHAQQGRNGYKRHVEVGRSLRLESCMVNAPPSSTS